MFLNHSQNITFKQEIISKMFYESLVLSEVSEVFIGRF